MRPLACLLLLFAACDPPKRWEVKQVDPARITVLADKLNLRHDVVGAGAHAAPSTFVLVDATNGHAVDADVSLGGELLDASGRPLATLRVESLPIPAGGTRTFALVADRKYDSAASARISVAGATEAPHHQKLAVTRGNIHRQGEDLLASAILENTSDRHVQVVVMAAFYDADGRPLTRPFSVVELDGETTYPAQFTGPPGSTKGYIFIGQTVF